MDFGLAHISLGAVLAMAMALAGIWHKIVKPYKQSILDHADEAKETAMFRLDIERRVKALEEKTVIQDEALNLISTKLDNFEKKVMERLTESSQASRDAHNKLSLQLKDLEIKFLREGK